MKPFVVLLLSVLIHTGCTQRKASENNKTTIPMKSMADRFQGIVDSMFEEVPNTKGIIMHVEAPDQNISWTGAAGWADSTTQRKLLPTDPALIASITKTYVAAAILRLVENGTIQLDQTIKGLFSDSTQNLLSQVGYKTDSITIAHLCTHTSGITDYVNTTTFQKATTDDPNHEWTRFEQIELAMSFPVKNEPGLVFEYSETNYLLLTEIIEQQTRLPFYAAMRALLKYRKHHLNETWFVQLEKAPIDLLPLVRQYAGQFQVESYSLNASFDLFGGGGIAASAKDVAQFTQLLFTGKLFDRPETKDLLYHTVATTDGEANAYYMGIAKTSIGPYEAYGHGGFWGTSTQYFPEFNASATIFLMERDEWPKYLELLEIVAELLEKQPINK